MGPRVGVGKLKSGVAPGCVGWSVTFEGVEACIVANRSTGGVETGLLHPAVQVQINNVKRIFLFTFRLNGFKVALLTSQNLDAKAPASGHPKLFFRRDDISESKPYIARRQV